MLFTEENFTEFLESLEGSAFKKKEIKKLKKHVADIVQYLNEEMEDTIFTELENYLYEYLPEAKKQKNVISMSDEDVEAAERQAQELAAYYEALDVEQYGCINSDDDECQCWEINQKRDKLKEISSLLSEQPKFISLKDMKEQMFKRPIRTIEEIDKDFNALFGTEIYEVVPLDEASSNIIKSFVSWQGNDIITPGRTVFEAWKAKQKRFIILDSKGKPQSEFLSKKEAKEQLKELQEYYDEYYDCQVVKVKIKAKKIKK